MKYELILTSRFKKSLKRCKKRGLDITKLNEIIDKLLQGQPLEEKYRDHALKGSFNMFRECHIQADWLLVYLIEDSKLTLTLIDTGSHADIFDM